jgi:hypothetical protein
LLHTQQIPLQRDFSVNPNCLLLAGHLAALTAS